MLVESDMVYDAYVDGSFSATIDKAEEFGKWICDLKEKDTYLIGTQFRPVPLTHYLYTDDQLLETYSSSNLNKVNLDKAYAFYKSKEKQSHKANTKGKLESISKYLNKKEFDQYVYGSADVVGLMCLKVFVKGNQQQYKELKPYAMSLGSAFQKVNFLRDLKADHDGLNRSYFPNLNIEKFDERSKQRILNEIDQDFSHALKGIFKLPSSAKFGVYTAYKYYLKLLNKLRKTHPLKIKSSRIRVPNYQKVNVLARSYVRYRLNIL